MDSVAKVIITGLAAYTLLAVFIPAIRLVYWRNTPKKFGAISYFGVAIFLWIPVLGFAGLIEVTHPVWYGAALLGIGISFFGYVIDSV